MTQQSVRDRIMARNPEPDTAPDEKEGRIPRSRKWPVRLGMFLACLVAVAGGVVAGMNYSGIRAVFVKDSAVAAREADNSPAATPFTEHIKTAGIRVCSSLFPALGTALTNGTKFSVQTSWNPQEPDTHAVGAMIGMNYAAQNYSGPAAGVIFATPNGKTCEGAMVRVAPFSVGCDQIPALLPAGSQPMNSLQDVAVYSLGGGGNALLLPAEKSCIVVSVLTGAQ